MPTINQSYAFRIYPLGGASNDSQGRSENYGFEFYGIQPDNSLPGKAQPLKAESKGIIRLHLNQDQVKSLDTILSKLEKELGLKRKFTLKNGEEIQTSG